MHNVMTRMMMATMKVMMVTMNKDYTWMLVVYMDTFLPSLMFLTSIPLSWSARSNPKLQPRKKLTRSSRHRSLMSVTCTQGLPSYQQHGW